MDRKQLEQKELEVLNSGVWGTIAPHSTSAAKALAEYTGGKYGLLCHSADAAYDAVLRHLGARFAGQPHGDVVIVGERSMPSDSLVALCVGAEPIFASVCGRCDMITPDGLREALTSAALPIRAAVLDYYAEGEMAEKYPLAEVSRICREGQIPLVLMAGGCIGARHDGQPLTAFADAVIYTLGKGSAVDAGGGGLIVTDVQAVWAGAFAYHNCGRSPGAGCSLVMDDIVGGDMRVTEWIAVAAEDIFDRGALAVPSLRVPVNMKDQPVFQHKK
ncbi:MAG: DegT/DnrJ/EryC1/StrS family aminotransferase [Clostridia bacterium]|nr:DegT/DnrJ/EryC1/StrS family aminotransferase [Clostridia bacterium]